MDADKLVAPVTLPVLVAVRVAALSRPLLLDLTLPSCVDLPFSLSRYLSRARLQTTTNQTIS